MNRIGGVTFAALSALIAFTSSAAQVGLYVPAFRAPQKSPLGLNAATVVNLAVWKTLRKAPYPNPEGLSFGDAIVRWSEEPLGSATPLEAAKSTGVQLILDGSVFAYGAGGAVVTTRLYITAPTDQDLSAQTWTLNVGASNVGSAQSPSSGVLTLENDIFPERILQFVSIPLKGDDLKTFESAGLLQVHQGSPTGPVIGEVGDNFRAFQQSGTVAQITTDTGLKGYLILPRVTPELVEVASFTGGVIRVMRGDWNGAVSLFGDLERSERTPTSLKVDSLLLIAHCLEKLDKSGSEFVERAAALSPSAPRVLKYKVMVTTSQIMRLLKSGQTEAARGLNPVLASAIDNVALVSAKDDEWVEKARKVASLLAGGNSSELVSLRDDQTLLAKCVNGGCGESGIRSLNKPVPGM